ncbi:hypothetical protein [Nocardia salmonicida]|uniref:hypothetical protein n=1 Tax=Nocardia salmonicida TaxID=53431 RepID=UPI0034339D65
MTTFQTPAPIAVTIEVLAGNVTVIATDRTDTVVEVRPADASKKADVRAAEQTRIDFTAGTLTVHTPKSWRTNTPFGGNPSVEVTIEVPTGSQLTSTTGVGRVLGIGELGRCELEVSLGDITIERPTDSVTAKTAKGDIHVVEAADGVLRLETSLGELSVGIAPGSAARLEADTQRGTVHNQLAPAGSSDKTVHIVARNALGNIIIQHVVAA